MLLEAKTTPKRPHLNLSLVGGFALSTGDAGLIPITNRKASALLAYLAVKPTRTETRERLAGLLWSDRGEEQARASLRQCVKQLRTMFDSINFTGLIADRQSVSLETAYWSTDLQLIIKELKHGRVSPNLMSAESTPDKILYGFESLDQSFSSWLHVVRQHHNDALLQGLQSCLHANGHESKKAAEALVFLDPSHEEAHRYLIRHHADAGNMAAALDQYNNLWNLLDIEYDAEPADETQALIVAIKSRTPMPQLEVAKANSPLSPKSTTTASHKSEMMPLLAVTAFEPIQKESQSDRLVAGFRQELVASLVRFRDWGVFDQNMPASSLNLNNPGGQMRKYCIEGAYLTEHQKVELVITLKNSINGEYIWSERIEIGRDNFFHNQRKVIAKIANSLSIYISNKSFSSAIASHEIDEDMYLNWIKGYSMIWSWDPNLRKKAESLFQSVIKNCPEFAPAYSGLASIYNTVQMINPGIFPNKEMHESACDLAQKSVALDPLDVRNQVALAWSKGMLGKYDQAENHHRQVCELNPNNPTTLISCANGLAMCGDKSGAQAMCEEAEQFFPMLMPVHWAYMASTYFVCGDYEKSASAAEKAGPVIPITPGWRAAAHGMSGNKNEAKSAAADFIDLVSSRWQGEKAFSTEAAAIWFLHHCPVKNPAVRVATKKGLHVAGLL